ncbi:MAG: cell division ATP-binding protein FtsE [Gammaproteobacteria bacterium]|nr:cell division ATP-binding protein FtsE [Gammaproteobacteria bacterium]MDH3411116.1 cell division ATP-binding protein FtsE [Gammaproteobacteria bacterium]
MIEFHNVTKRYRGGVEALRNISARIDAGEMVFLTGHSGAGKSTLLRLTTLVERATRGQIIIGGHNLSRIPARKVPIFRRHIGVVFQDHRLLRDRTVFDNVALPLVVSGHGHLEIARRVRAALDKVDLLGKEKQFPVVLSGGEQQRVGIARAVVHKPPVLLADEPTGNLDPDLSREIMGLFAQFNQVGVTVLVATHDLDLVHQFGSRVLTLRNGQFVDGHTTC